MNPRNIETLKRMAVHEKELHKVMTYFIDHLCEQRGFASAGVPHRDPLLNTVMQEVGRHVLGAQVVLHETMLIRLPAFRFVHGIVRLGDSLGSVIYFEELHTGVLALSVDMSTGEMMFVRIRCAAVPAGEDPSVN